MTVPPLNLLYLALYGVRPHVWLCTIAKAREALQVVERLQRGSHNPVRAGRVRSVMLGIMIRLCMFVGPPGDVDSGHAPLARAPLIIKRKLPTHKGPAAWT